MECPICCCKYTDKIRTEIECLFCNKKYCKQCAKDYILSVNVDPHCLYCKNSWSREFISNNLPQTFLSNELKIQRQNILFDREKSLLPSSQIDVQIEIERRKRAEERNNLIKRRNELKAELDALNNKIYYGENNITPNTIINDKEDYGKFVRACPATDCRGFLDTKWTCGICSVKVCSDCHEIKEEEHKCIDENIATAKLIKKDSKPCPKCGSLIFKISGCNQMFCTSCKVSFDWITGKIYVNNIHNPHYFDYLRTHNLGITPRTDGDIECGGLPNIYTFTNYLKNTVSFNQQKTINDIYRCINHINFVTLRGLPIDNIIINNVNLRVKYLLKDIDETKFKKLLQEKEKERDKHREIRNILNMFATIASDHIRDINQKLIEKVEKEKININTINTINIYNAYQQSYQNNLSIINKDDPEIEKIIKYVEDLRNYTNTSFMKVHKNFNCTVPYIGLIDYTVTNYSGRKKYVKKKITTNIYEDEPQSDSEQN